MACFLLGWSKNVAVWKNMYFPFPLTLDNVWYLGMNLNASDNHIMGYTTGWDDNDDIGNNNSALLQDYLSQEVWNMPISNIAIVRHQKVGKVNLNVFHQKKLFLHQTF